MILDLPGVSVDISHWAGVSEEFLPSKGIRAVTGDVGWGDEFQLEWISASVNRFANFVGLITKDLDHQEARNRYRKIRQLVRSYVDPDKGIKCSFINLWSFSQMHPKLGLLYKALEEVEKSLRGDFPNSERPERLLASYRALCVERVYSIYDIQKCRNAAKGLAPSFMESRD